MDQINGLLVAIPALPLLAAIVVACLGPKILRGSSHLVVIAALALSCLASVMLFFEIRSAQILSVPGTEIGFERIVTLWTWLGVDNALGAHDFRIDVVLRADPLTSMMLMMVTFVSLFVALFASGYMRGDRGYWRFFAYFSLFVFSMCMLVSVSSFLLLFVFWEGVGLCSYLLIGFWYDRPSAAAAGMKAFLVNRVGDFGFTLAIFLIWIHYGTLSFHDTAIERSAERGDLTVVTDPVRVAQLAASEGGSSDVTEGVLGQRRIRANRWVGGGAGLAIALLLMLGACGKSAQFPLHVWLPDAMEGPTPVSALIHAATMVTAGVYLVARCTPLFLVSPTAQLCVAGIGGLTALLAALIALTQFDLKRVLAYSTISQLGYMFLALGTGTLAGISAGMFHLLTHAFFKALLFLGAGSVMHAMGNVIDMRRFGGLRRLMPYTYWTFLLGALALAGIFPLSGFWSKDAVLAAVHDKVHWLEAGDDHPGHAAADASAAADATAASASAALPKLDDATRHRHARAYHWLYIVGVLTAWLTAVYTFRAVFLTFFGPLKVPGEAGAHAHESPPSMVVPLVVLAVGTCVAGVLLDRSYLDGVHPFAAWIGGAPSLSLPSLAETPQPGEFHVQVAATSMLVALVGIGVAAFFFLGDRREARVARSFFGFEWLLRWFDVATVARFRRWPWVAAVERSLRRVGLGWLATVSGYALLFVVLLLSAPLVVFRFVTPYALSQHKFYLDELYDWLIVRPCRAVAWLAAVLDRRLIDGLVDAVGSIPMAIGRVLRPIQSGLTSSYLWATAVALVVLIWLSMVNWT